MRKGLATHSVSIAMATYNGEKYIREQLDSLAAQTYLPAELVVSDDGSTDSTLEIIRTFSLTAPFPVKIFENSERLGYKSNFLKAATLCTGDIIAFCDQDDIWLDRKLEICSREFSDAEVLLCIHSGIVATTEGSVKGRHPDFRGRRVHKPLTLDPLESRPGFAMVFSKGILEICDNANRPLDIWSPKSSSEMMAHDEWVWYLASIFGKIVTLSEPLVIYRRHSSNSSIFGPGPTLVSSVVQSFRTVDYESSIERDIDNYEYLHGMILKLDDKYRLLATKAASLFEERASSRMIRSRIYAHDSSIFSRFGAFLSLLSRGVYFGSKKFRIFGLKSAA